MAVAARGGPAGVDEVIFHSDRGSQYLSGAYLQQLARLGMRASVGRTGVCWDNSVAEAFWSSLKRELIHRRPFATRADARRVVFAWINWYNRTRLHSTLNYRSPLQWEQRYVTSTPTAAHKPHHPVSGQRGEPQINVQNGPASSRGALIFLDTDLSMAQEFFRLRRQPSVGGPFDEYRQNTFDAPSRPPR